MVSFTKVQMLNFVNKRIDESNYGTGPNDCSSRYFFWMTVRALIENDLLTPTQINTILTEKWG